MSLPHMECVEHAAMSVSLLKAYLVEPHSSEAYSRAGINLSHARDGVYSNLGGMMCKVSACFELRTVDHSCIKNLFGCPIHLDESTTLPDKRSVKIATRDDCDTASHRTGRDSMSGEVISSPIS